MRNRERDRPDANYPIRGAYADIVFDSPFALWNYLEGLVGHHTLYQSADDLRFPITGARLDYSRDDADQINLMATIDLPAHDSITRDERSWQETLSTRIAETLTENGATVHQLPHHTHTLYAEISSHHAAVIEFDATLDMCHVHVELVPLASLYEAIDGEGEQEVSDETPDHLDTLTHFSRVWSLVIDQTIDEFGDPRVAGDPKPRIVIAAPADLKALPTPPNKEAPGPDVFIPGVTIPTAEQGTATTDSFRFIGGLTRAKERLEDIAATYNDPTAAAMYGVASGRHFMLHGPPGTGKTVLVEAFAEAIGARLHKVDSTQIVSKWVGESGKNIQELFAAAKKSSDRIVIFFDEFDTIAKRGDGGTSERVDVKKLLNTIVIDLQKHHSNIIIAAATNAELDDIEPSLIRAGRLEPISAQAPDDTERIDVWAAVLTKSLHSFERGHEPAIDDEGRDLISLFSPYENDIDVHALARATEGMTGADFEIILERARRQCYRTYRTTGNPAKVSQANLLREVQNYYR